jgi:hypothetical protein
MIEKGTMQETVFRSRVLIEGCVVSDPYGGRYESHVAVYPAERFAGMARNPAIVWALARGDQDEDEFRAHDGCRWAIRRATFPAPSTWTR